MKTILAILAIAVGVGGVGYWGISHARQPSGYSFRTTPLTVSYTTAAPGRVAISLANNTDREIKIVGLKSNCPCVTLDEMPLPAPVPAHANVLVTCKVQGKTESASADLLWYIDTGDGMYAERVSVAGMRVGK